MKPIAPPGAVLIPLHGKAGTIRAWAIVDEADAPAAQAHRWYVHTGPRAKATQRRTPYATRNGTLNGRKRAIYLHRELLGLPRLAGAEIGDHLNHDTLDNRRSNLRVIPRSVNGQNRIGANRNSRSGIRGVWWNAGRQGWDARVKLNYRRYNLGRFRSKEEAAAAVKAWRAEHMPYSLDALERPEADSPADVVQRVAGSNRVLRDDVAAELRGLLAQNAAEIDLVRAAVVAAFERFQEVLGR